jgi:hypothetical protein
MFNITTVVFDGPSPPLILQMLQEGTPQDQKVMNRLIFRQCVCVYIYISNGVSYCIDPDDGSRAGLQNIGP